MHKFSLRAVRSRDKPVLFRGLCRLGDQPETVTAESVCDSKDLEFKRSLMNADDLIRAADLGMTVSEVRRRWPQAVERVGFDGESVWLRTELEDSVESVEGRP
jgi:hypothetical protein